MAESKIAEFTQLTGLGPLQEISSTSVSPYLLCSWRSVCRAVCVVVGIVMADIHAEFALASGLIAPITASSLSGCDSFRRLWKIRDSALLDVYIYLYVEHVLKLTRQLHLRGKAQM